MPRQLFQFHKGTIRTNGQNLSYIQHIDFNSIKVRLEHTKQLIHLERYPHFNSIKVRLEQSVKHESHNRY